MLARDEPVALRAGEGVLALAVDAPEMIVDSLALCRDGAMLDCVQTGRLPRGGGLLVTQLGAGRYCLAQMKIVRDTETLFTHVADEDANPRCFTVEPDVVSYPGHLVMESALASGEMIAFGYGFERRRASIEHRERCQRDTHGGDPATTARRRPRARQRARYGPGSTRTSRISSAAAWGYSARSCCSIDARRRSNP